MEYYFKIAGIGILIHAPFAIGWNSYIKTFEQTYIETPDVEYRMILTNACKPKGKLVHRGRLQDIYMDGELESRLHYFIGFEEPCMLYEETGDERIIYLNTTYLSSFQDEDNYCLFNALAFEKLLLDHEGLVLHCSYIVYEGGAILFSAPSGTGKSTQADLWKQYRDATIVNGDRAILMKVDGIYHAMGLPLCGSSNICLDMSVPIKAIVYLEQSPENAVYEVAKREEMRRLMSEVTINYHNTEAVMHAMDLVTDLSMQVPMYHLACNISEQAVECLEKELTI